MSDFTNGGGQDDGQDASDDSRPGLISSSSAPGGHRVTAVWSESADTDVPAATEQAGPPTTPTVELTATESRVLGSLIEKSFLTPDVYPMTTNALVTASNQKTNRDPVVDYSAVLIDGALMDLRQRNLVRRVHAQGSRSTKHRQTLDEALSLSERELVLMSVLLLRGPQTIGELRLRTERHDVGFDDLDAVESCLVAMASRPTPLVVQLERQPGHKENRWRHLLDAPGSVHDDPAVQGSGVQGLGAQGSGVQGSGAQGSGSQSATDVGSQPSRPPAPAAEPGLVERVDELEGQVATLQRQLAALAAKLGEPLD